MFGRDSFVLERRRVVAHGHAVDHTAVNGMKVGGLLLATLYYRDGRAGSRRTGGAPLLAPPMGERNATIGQS